MKGLWSEHFPATATATATATRLHVSPTKTNPPASRCLLCPKCNAAVWPRTSKTDKNPNREFYSCPAKSKDHKFFKWADEVNPNQLIDVPNWPNCGGCGAGPCRVRRETIGPDAGRILFLCRVKEGEGSCGYRVWQDELEISETSHGDERISSSQFTNNTEDIIPTLTMSRNTLEEKIVVNSRSTTVTRNLLEAKSYGLYSCENTELSGAALDVPSLSKTKMSKSISNAFCEAAQHLQNDLLTLLETMDVKDHVAMREAAEATFAALDHFLFSDQDFKNRVNELVHCASSLSEIEQSMPTNDSYQRLVKRCASDRKRLDEINCAHAEIINTVLNKKKCLKDMQEEISSTLEMLFEIEAEISCFEIELRNTEIALEQISRDKEELEGKSKKLFERKEEECAAAKASYDRARALLRYGFEI